MIAQLAVNAVVYGVQIALMASGFSLIFGVLRIVNFWHGEAYMFGGVIIYFLSVSAGLNYWVALLLAVVIVGAIGWTSDILVFRRFHGNLMGGVVAAVALSMGMQNSMWYILGPRAKGVPSVVTGSIEVLGAIVSKERIVVVAISLAVIAALIWFIRYTKLGKAMRAVQQNSEAALTVGISVNRICGVTFAIATGLAALSGGLIVPLLGVHPAVGQLQLILAFLTVILGGLGSVTGALIAAIMVGFIHSYVSAFLGMQFSLGLTFTIALIVLIVRPKGLLGHD